MNRPCRLTVDPCFGVGHGAVEYQANDLSLPRSRHFELQPILSLFVCQRIRIADAIASVVVTTETLLLPARGDRDPGPVAALAASRAKEIPQHGVVFAGAGEITDLCLLILCLRRDVDCAGAE